MNINVGITTASNDLFGFISMRSGMIANIPFLSFDYGKGGVGCIILNNSCLESDGTMQQYSITPFSPPNFIIICVLSYLCERHKDFSLKPDESNHRPKRRRMQTDRNRSASSAQAQSRVS